MTMRRALGPMVRIRDLRSARGLTQRELVEKIAEFGVETSEPAVSNIEAGRRRGSARLLTAWAMALDVDPLTVWPGNTRGELAEEVDRVTDLRSGAA